MRLWHRQSSTPAEGGFAIVEVLVSGVVAVVAAAGIMSLMQATVRQAGDQRARTQSYAIAQEDQARLRATRVPTLRAIPAAGETRTITVGKTVYTVKSTAKFVNDVSDTLSCGSDSSTEDYLKISSEVTWPNMSPIPTTAIRSIISPPSASLDPKKGTLVFNARNAADVALSGLSVSGTGAGTFGGTTDSKGCAVFLEQATGEYTLKISGGGTGIVDVDGVPLPANKPLTVNPQTTTSVDLLYDKPGSVPINFKTTNYANGEEAANATSLIAFNSGMTTAKQYTFSSATSYEAKSLFPFTSPISFFVGTCTENTPIAPQTTGLIGVTVPSGTKTASQNLLMPALLLNVQKNGSATNNMTVEFTPEQCDAPPFTKTTQSVSSKAGRLAQPELPWGTYTVCVEATFSSGSGKNKKTWTMHEDMTVPVMDKTTTKTLNVDDENSDTNGC